LNAAWIEAVRSAIGMYLSISTEVLNDDIYENVVAHSRGRVNSYKEVSASKEDGVWHVTIIAEIEKDVLVETVAAASSATVSVDSQVIAAVATEVERQKSVRELIREFGTSFKPDDFIITSVSKPELNDDGSVSVVLHVDFNSEKYRQVYLNDLVKLLEQISDYKGENNYRVDVIEHNSVADASRYSFGDFIFNGEKDSGRGSAYYLNFSDLSEIIDNLNKEKEYFAIVLAKDSSFFHVFLLNKVYQNDFNDILLKRNKKTINVILQAYNGNNLANTRAFSIDSIRSIGFREQNKVINLFPLFEISGWQRFATGYDEKIQLSQNSEFLKEGTEIRVFVSLK
jgi:hypothetical protein